MIVSFSVANFRSFLGEETLSLVASKRLSGQHEQHAMPIPDSSEKVLRTAVLYGANGAGKSNLFKALQYLKSIALNPQPKSGGTGRQQFRFDGNSEPSSFDLQFIAENKLYRFGFKVDDQKIIEEWLLQVIGNRERPIYERETDLNGNVKINAQGLKTAGEKLRALATVGGPQNQSFLATIHATLQSSDIDENLRGILNWFNRALFLVEPDESFAPIGHLLEKHSDFMEFAGKFLRDSSTGVDHLKVIKTEVSEEDLRNLIPDAMFSKVMDEIRDGKATIFGIDEGNELIVEKAEKNRYYRIAVQAAHEHQKGKVIPLDLTEESDGTQRLLNLVPALHYMRAGYAAYFIDEIDRSMHPILIWKFLDFFLKTCNEGRRQIIVTTHESNLLDLDLLRRDEIWFAEKDSVGATKLYSMADFKVRNDLEIRKHYLQGRFGAVPFLGNLDRLLAESERDNKSKCEKHAH